MGRFTRRTIARWGGHNGDENPMALEPGELQDELNVYLRGETLGTRPGTTYDELYTSSFAPGGAVQLIHECRDSFDTTRNVLVIANGKMYVVADNSGAVITEINDGTSPLTVTAGQNNFWTSAQHKSDVYMAGGASSDVDLMKWTIQDDGTAEGSINDPNSVTLTGTSNHPKYIFQKWNRLWLNGFDGTAADDNPMIGRFSALNDGDTWPEENTIGGTSAVGGFSAYGEEFSTGWGQYTDNSGDWLLYLTNKRIYSVSQTGSILAPFAKTDEIGAGCVSQRAFVDLGIDHGDAIYVSDRGIHSLRQSQQHGNREDTFLSWKIRDLFDTVNRSRLKYAVGGYWRSKGMVIFALSTGSNTSHDLILCLDLKRHARGQEDLNARSARWFQWRLAGKNVNTLVPMRDSNDEPYLYVGTTAGDVIKFDTAASADLSSAYSVKFRTKDDDMGAPGLTKTIGRCFVKMQPGGSYAPTMTVHFDYGERSSTPIALAMPKTASTYGTGSQYGTATYAQANKTFRRVVRPVGSGETVGFEFMHATASEPFYLAGLTYEVAARGEDIGEATS